VVGADLGVDLAQDLGILAQELLGTFPPLADLLLAVGEPRATLVDHVRRHAEVDDVAQVADSLTVNDVELRDAEGWSHLVLDHLHLGAVADDVVAILEIGHATDVEADGAVELERVSTGRRLWIPEHDADLHANLVDEDHTRVGLADDTRQLAQRLRHQTRLQAHVRVPHLPFDLGARHQSRNRIDDDDVDGTAANQHLDDVERLLTRVRLGNQEVVDVDTELARVHDIESVLRVDERRDAARKLRFGDDRLRQRRLARALGPEDLDDASTRDSSDAERDVEAEASGRHDLDPLLLLAVAEPHDRAVTELLSNLCHREIRLRLRGVLGIALFGGCL
jgi:hypothetical protein